MLSAYEFVFKNWFFSVDSLYVEKNMNEKAFPYVKEMLEEEDSSSEGFSNLSSDMYEYKLKGNIPSNMFLEARSIPQTVDLQNRFEAARLLCSKLNIKLDEVSGQMLSSRSLIDSEFVEWLNALNENIYVKVFLQDEDFNIFKMAGNKTIPHGNEAITQADVRLLKIGVDKFCTDMTELSEKYTDEVLQKSIIQSKVNKVRDDYVAKEILGEKNKEIREQVKSEQVVETPAQKEIQKNYNKNMELIIKMQEEVDLIEEEL